MVYLGLTGREYFLIHARDMWGYNVEEAMDAWNHDYDKVDSLALSAWVWGEKVASRQLRRQANKIERNHKAAADRLLASVNL